jgi:hypothetical protein
MGHRRPLYLLLPILLVIAAACAPDNLDITPTAAPTPVPMITVYVTGAVTNTGTMVEISQGSRIQDVIEAAGGTLDNADLQRVNLASVVRDGDQIHVPAQGEALAAEPTEEATPEPATDGGTRAELETLLGNIPGQFDAGTIRWRRDNSAEPLFVERTNGHTARISLTEAGGGLMELTLGVFATPEDAQAYYSQLRESLDTLQRAEEREGFPTPNAFGSGTYGSEAILTEGKVFIRISIPRFSSTSGDPLTPAGRELVRIVGEAQGS